MTEASYLAAQTASLVLQPDLKAHFTCALLIACDPRRRTGAFLGRVTLVTKGRGFIAAASQVGGKRQSATRG